MLEIMLASFPKSHSRTRRMPSRRDNVNFAIFNAEIIGLIYTINVYGVYKIDHKLLW